MTLFVFVIKPGIGRLFRQSKRVGVSKACFFGNIRRVPDLACVINTHMNLPDGR